MKHGQQHPTVARYKLGSIDEAAAALDKLCKDAHAEATYPQIHHLLHLIFAQRGKFEDAAEYRERLKLTPNAVANETVSTQLKERQTLGVI